MSSVDPQLVEEWRVRSLMESVVRTGFSDRLNFLIDCCDIDAPSLKGGRLSFLMELTGRSRTTVNEWLNKDAPPGRELRALVEFLANHLDGEQNPEQLEAWLLYGETIVTNPVTHTGFLARRESVRLAMQLITAQARLHDISHTSYDFQSVLEHTVRLLENFDLVRMEDVQAGHLQVIHMYLKQYTAPLKRQ